MRRWTILLCMLVPLGMHAAPEGGRCQSDSPNDVPIDELTLKEFPGATLLSEVLVASLNILRPHGIIMVTIVDCTQTGEYTELIYSAGTINSYNIIVGRALFKWDAYTVARVAAGHACNISLGYANESTEPDEATKNTRRPIVEGCIDDVLERLTAPDEDPRATPEEPGVEI